MKQVSARLRKQFRANLEWVLWVLMLSLFYTSFFFYTYFLNKYYLFKNYNATLFYSMGRVEYASKREWISRADNSLLNCFFLDIMFKTNLDWQ